MTSPIYLFATFALVINAFYSDKKNDRSLYHIVPSIVGFLGFVGLTFATWYDIPELSYAAMFFACAGVKSAIPIGIAWMTSSLNDWVSVATASGMSNFSFFPLSIYFKNCKNYKNKKYKKKKN
jgi:hypothetical protein